MNELLLVMLAYMIGSVPTAVWISRSQFNIDIRDYGSGNAGATNTFRVLGAKWGTTVMLIDMLKGLLAVKLAGAYIPGLGGISWRERRGNAFWADPGDFPLDGAGLCRYFPAGPFPDKVCIAEFHPRQPGIPDFYHHHLQRGQ